jgi:hypothetical protein
MLGPVEQRRGGGVMKDDGRFRSAGLLLAMIALAIGLAGAATAAPGVKKIAKNAVKSKQIAKNAVKSAEIAAGAVKASDIAPDAVTGDHVLESSLGAVPAVQGTEQFFKRETPSATAATETAARAAATPVALGSAGPLSVYGKCFKSTAVPANPGVHAEVFIATSAPGAIFSGDDSSSNNGFIDPGTPETDRSLISESSFAGVGDPGTLNLSDIDEQPAHALAGDTALIAQLVVATKVGSPEDGDGLFGPGDRCLFAGVVNSN